jgi:hypothetical protein
MSAEPPSMRKVQRLPTPGRGVDRRMISGKTGEKKVANEGRFSFNLNFSMVNTTKISEPFPVRSVMASVGPGRSV